MSREQFLEVISEFSRVPVERIRDDSSIRDELGVDSLRMVHLIVELESRHGLRLASINSMDEIGTVAAMFKTMTGTGRV